MTETYYNLIGGRKVGSGGGVAFENENPAQKGSVLGWFQSSQPADVALAVDAASEAFRSWRRVRMRERQRLGRMFLERLRDAKEELARIVTLENGKTLRESRGEVDSAIKEGEHHVNQVSTFCGETLPMDSAEGYSGWMQFHPLGVVAIISPWNFPINVMCRKALPALLTGNTAVYKPATFTPWSGVLMAELFEKAGFPPGVFNCVTGLGSSLGNALIDDSRVRALSFTGSTEVGRKIQERAAKHLTRTQLELGGKSALIVMEDADLDAAVDAAVTAGFACAGQWCTSTSRLLLQKGIYNCFIDKLAKRCEGVVVGDPMSEATNMGPVAGPEQYKNISAAIDRAKAEGARFVTGGKVEGRLGETGYFIRPTLFADVNPGMALFREEVFGPVLAATPFKDPAEGISLANDSVYGLSSSIFTGDIHKSMSYVNEIEAGLAHVNIHSGYKDPELAFGGWKTSGFGPPENGRTGLEFFVERKAVYVNWK